MAKKFNGKNLVYYLDNFIVSGYNAGLFHSIIINTSFLLVMALTLFNEPITKPIRLTLSFDKEQHEEISVEHFTEISLSDKDSSESDKSEIEQPIIDQNFDEENLNIDYVEDNKEINSSIFSELSDLSPAYLNQEIQMPINKKTSPKKSPRASYTKSNTNQGQQNINRGRGFGNGLGDIGQRLKRANAGTGDIQISLAWNTVDDIDLHVRYISWAGQSYMYWGSRMGIGGGILDVDMNANPAFLTNKPVENIFWPHGSSPSGQFVVGVHNFKNWSGAPIVPVIIIINNKGQINTLTANAVFGLGPIEVTRFNSE